MYVERSRKKGKGGLEEENVTNLEEREIKEERHATFVLTLAYHISVTELHKL